MGASRSKRLLLNTISSFLYQITAIICGFIVPRLILLNYGSDVNGLVNSITQFLSVITLMEFGIGAVVQSSLYKPLAENDYIQISKVVKSAGDFFSKLAFVLLLYVILLILVFPYIIHSNFGSMYTATLIIAISISAFAQYYFGAADMLLLLADQRAYIQYFSQISTLFFNTVVCVVLIASGSPIHIVKLTASCVYLIRPLLVRVYVDRNYHIDRRIEYDVEPIAQKWNGIAQHVAAYILNQTDILVLTILSTLVNVSIYSIYNMIMIGVKNLFTSLVNGIQPLMGELYAKNEMEELSTAFEWTEWIIHTGAVVIFGCVSVLIVPFVLIYTDGVNDANYNVPLFALLITGANTAYCIRLPYNILILAAGHYKQTQINYIIASSMNLVISIVSVHFYGLVGVAFGTLCAMIYQTVWMAVYDSKFILRMHIYRFYKHIFVDIGIFIVGYGITSHIHLENLNYFSWIKIAFIDAIIWSVVSYIINLLVYPGMIRQLKNHIGARGGA